ncbi:type II toxin-antitoxin system HigB family toxin [Aureimonas altamirensis]|uniref:type II toxin-antitoxin system HigB family toxin n=1 Tax=Aureimonas altamirensis TaxID=370622 RepID=UPI0020371474|nr:type II toxin-antitoxin system HigB family toxin [Aureimonas altamirensis]MCM2503297.1 type II toxin-antitoxin system HigB family toxin [Aureimonas altamirensis]
MQILSKRTLKLFWQAHPRAEPVLRTWYALAMRSDWRTPADVKRQFGTTVDFVADNRIVFDLGGNKYRLIVHVSYKFGRILIKFVGTHAEYDRINPETV